MSLKPKINKTSMIWILFTAIFCLLYMIAIQSRIVLCDLKNKRSVLNFLLFVPWIFEDPSVWSISNKNNIKTTKKVPDAIIIGAKKAGTRALLEFIRTHPKVQAAGHEVHYFDRNYDLGEEWYRSMMPLTTPEQITIEKTPNYLVTPNVPQRVYDTKPNMKIILIVRDPVDRAISDYTQSSTKHLRQRAFENVVFEDFNKLSVNEERLLIHTGKYTEHLKNWLQYFTLDQFCFINGETLVTDPARELKKLQTFLGVEQIITKEHFFFNSTKKFPCLNRPRKTGAAFHCLRGRKGRPHPPVSLRGRIALYQFFEPFNNEFYNITGINFEWEKRNPLYLADSS